MKNLLKKITAIAVCAAVAAPLANAPVFGGETEARAAAASSTAGSRSYSSRYTEITTLNSYGERGTDGWRNGLVTGNGENGVIDSAAPAEDVMIFQNMKFSYPTNAIRVTPDMSSVREETIRDIIEYDGEYLSRQGSIEASNAMLNAASAWVKEMNLASSWGLQNTYAFHPGHQLRLKLEGAENGEETEYQRYTDYQTAEIGADWTDKDGNKWERKTFASREDNVNVTSMKSESGAKINMTITVDDIAKMSNEGGVGTELAKIRYRKVVSENGDYIGFTAHYPYFHNSQFNNAGLSGITRIIVKGDGAGKSYVFGTETASDFANPVGGATETEINLGYDKNPAVKITNADEVILITKTERDLEMGTLGAFEAQDNTAQDVKNGMAYAVTAQLIADTAAAAGKYSTAADYSDFDYAVALAPSAQKHAEIFNRLSYDVCVTDEDKAMRSYTNEELIAAQQNSKTALLPAMLERLYYNGRFANICSSGIQAPRLGGMWTGAWGCEWSGDYTTDANINLQIAGANIGSVPEETVGFINVMLNNITDWQLNAKQIYGIDNAIMAPTRTDGYSAVTTHFASNFPGQMWLSGASWLILPIYEYYQCYGNQNIPLTPDIRKELEFTGNKYAGYTEITDKNGTEGAYHDYNIKDADGNTVVYNMRNTLGLSDERAEKILSQGYFDLEKDILYPMLTKTANFWLGFVSPKYYVKDGKAYYDENHTALGEGESYLIAPSYSPENWPSNIGTGFTSNAVMDISSTRSAMDMAVSLEAKLNGEANNANIEKYSYLAAHLPEYLYEPSGELKEWALRDYEENYGHRHGSQLYGLWPSYEGETNTELFEGAKKLIETKNSIDTGDSKSGHGWLHRGLVMARLKDGKGVRDTLLPLTIW
ncbi:MAG: glycosyl hydrolase family 95 catalytic domain-containing protein, partial [Candidatus Ornithomonoglobus sp.]